MAKKKIKDVEKDVMAAFYTHQEKEHIRRVLAYALHIWDKERKGDKDILMLAALLHDIGRTDWGLGLALEEDTKGHAALGAVAARKYLINNGWPPDIAAAVSQCIRTHSRKGNRGPTSWEAKLLYDADKLDILGATGIARCIGYAHDDDKPFVKATAHNAGKNARKEIKNTLARALKKSVKLADTLYTKEAKHLAKNKISLMKRYISALKKESKITEKYGVNSQ